MFSSWCRSRGRTHAVPCRDSGTFGTGSFCCAGSDLHVSSACVPASAPTAPWAPAWVRHRAGHHRWPHHLQRGRQHPGGTNYNPNNNNNNNFMFNREKLAEAARKLNNIVTRCLWHTFLYFYSIFHHLTCLVVFVCLIFLLFYSLFRLHRTCLLIPAHQAAAQVCHSWCRGQLHARSAWWSVLVSVFFKGTPHITTFSSCFKH